MGSEMCIRDRSIYIGFLHRDDYQFKALTYDFIEPYRVGVDRIVFRLFSRDRLKMKHSYPKDGGVLLNKEGKVLLANAFGTYFMEQEVKTGEITTNRIKNLQRDAQQLANELLREAGVESIESGVNMT